MTNEQKEVATRQQKESKAGHTPTPLSIELERILRRSFMSVGNREACVRAVNSHEALLEAMKAISNESSNENGDLENIRIISSNAIKQATLE